MFPRRARTFIAACGLPLIAGCATPEPKETANQADLDPVLTFTDPAMCKFSDDTAKLIGGFVGGDGDTLSDDWIRPGTVPVELRDRFGPIRLVKHDGWWVIHTEARGMLWGLPLVAIAQEFPEGGDPGGFTLEFKASPRDVERAARARGFVARANKDVPMGPPDGLLYSVGLHPTEDGRRSSFGCGYS